MQIPAVEIFEPKHAGFWIRFAAGIIDAIILGIIGSLFFNSASVSIGTSFTNPQTLIGIVYVIGFWIWKGATPGKMILGLEIRGEDGSKLTPQKAVIRYLGYILSSIALFLGFIWIAFDSKKQGWHDKIAKTIVVYK